MTFYPTYAHRDGENWRIPLRLRVHEDRPVVEGLVARIVRSMAEVDSTQAARFRARFRDFLADSESLERVSFAFPGDPRGEVFHLRRAFR